MSDEEAPELIPWNRAIAAAVSFAVPGAGQLYKGHVRRAVFWFVVVVIGYIYYPEIAWMVHAGCILESFFSPVRR